MILYNWSVTAGNQCFYGICEYFCDAAHGVCGEKEILEGAFGSYLPSNLDAPQRSIKNPWARSYSKYDKAEWEGPHVSGLVFCMTVRNEAPYDRDKPLLNLIDVHILDFLTGQSNLMNKRHSVNECVDG